LLGSGSNLLTTAYRLLTTAYTQHRGTENTENTENTEKNKIGINTDRI
jgi:hypothetical protein